mmetsp:Transcript_24434/g.44917  ORF Transcript_24434/g.44917 Transcript_24434/m.44917 type:complete len:88 (+) Transcript_24434:50-313(+)
MITVVCICGGWKPSHTFPRGPNTLWQDECLSSVGRDDDITMACFYAMQNASEKYPEVWRGDSNKEILERFFLHHGTNKISTLKKPEI